MTSDIFEHRHPTRRQLRDAARRAAIAIGIFVLLWAVMPNRAHADTLIVAHRDGSAHVTEKLSHEECSDRLDSLAPAKGNPDPTEPEMKLSGMCHVDQHRNTWCPSDPANPITWTMCLRSDPSVTP